MPLTFDDREDLYIEIQLLRSKCDRLERECDSWRSKYFSLLEVSCVLGKGGLHDL